MVEILVVHSVSMCGVSVRNKKSPEIWVLVLIKMSNDVKCTTLV